MVPAIGGPQRVEHPVDLALDVDDAAERLPAVHGSERTPTLHCHEPLLESLSRLPWVRHFLEYIWLISSECVTVK